MLRPGSWLAAVMVLGCGAVTDPDDQPTSDAEGAFYLQFVDASSDPSLTCEVASHVAEIGSITQNVINLLEKHDVNDVTAFCTVSSDGSFSIEASIARGSTSFEALIADTSATPAPEAPALGTVSYASPSTVETFSSPPDVPCQFYQTQPQHEIAPGRAWLEFDCPRIEAPGQSCQVASGRFAFQKCEQ